MTLTTFYQQQWRQTKKSLLHKQKLVEGERRPDEASPSRLCSIQKQSQTNTQVQSPHRCWVSPPVVCSQVEIERARSCGRSLLRSVPATVWVSSAKEAAPFARTQCIWSFHWTVSRQRTAWQVFKLIVLASSSREMIFCHINSCIWIHKIQIYAWFFSWNMSFNSNNGIIPHISLLSSEWWIQNIELFLIFSNEFISWSHNHQVQLMDLASFRIGTTNSYIWIHMMSNLFKNPETPNMNFHIWIQTSMNSLFIWLFHLRYIYIYTYILNLFDYFMYEFICISIHMYEFMGLLSFQVWIHITYEFIHEIEGAKIPDDHWPPITYWVQVQSAQFQLIWTGILQSDKSHLSSDQKNGLFTLSGSDLGSEFTASFLRQSSSWTVSVNLSLCLT